MHGLLIILACITLVFMPLSATMDGIAAALEGAQAQQAAISLNLAGAMHPGYKASKVVTRAKDRPNEASSKYSSIVPQYETVIDFSQGPIQTTGILTDFALEGEGVFFELTNLAGEKIYTKKGNFHFDKDNQLVSVEGYKVSNNGSAPITKLPGGYDIQVNEQGSISQNGQNIGNIGAFKVQTDILERADGGFKLPKDKTAQPAEKFRILQGCVEGSNTIVSKQSLALIQASHQFNLNAENLKSLNENFNQLLQVVQGY